VTKPLFLDTSYILALINTQDEFHLRAQALANQINAPLLTTEAVLTETGNVQFHSVHSRGMLCKVDIDRRSREKCAA